MDGGTGTECSSETPTAAGEAIDHIEIAPATKHATNWR